MTIKSNFFVPNVVRMYGRWFFHGNQTKYLEQMVLHDVSNNTKIIKISTAAFSTKWFFECDLHLGNIVPVPSGIQNSIAEPKNIISI